MKLPVWPKDEHDIIDEIGHYVGFVNSPEERDYIIKAINCHEKFKTALEKIEDQANRAAMVQDRSVRIIKQTCRVIYNEAKQALKEKP